MSSILFEQLFIHSQVLSGDSVVIRGQPRGGPPPERTLSLSYITAPKLGRRGSDTGNDMKVDEVSLMKF